MADQESQWPQLTATLFRRPLTALPANSQTHITTSMLTSFMSTIESLHLPPRTIPYTSRFLDDRTYPHITSLTFTPTLPLSTLRNHPTLLAFEQSHTIQLVLQPTLTEQTPKKLAVFDMDSTIIQEEVIDLLAAEAGLESQVSLITTRAMNGELDFSDSLRERVALLKGLDEHIFESLKPRLTLTSGADIVLRVLRSRGVKTALLSGGFMPLATWIAAKLGIDHVYANDLAAESGLLTGLLAPDRVVVDSGQKELLLRRIAEDEGVETKEQVLAVGDGANDLPMMWAAGLGVAVNAKPKVQVEAPARLNGETALLDVLYLLGLTSEDIYELVDQDTHETH